MDILYKRSVRSYVRRSGRMTEHQRQGLDQLAAIYCLNFNDEFKKASLLDNKRCPIVLDIGFGMGESLIQQGLAQPETLFIGVEVHKKGVGNVVNQLEVLNIKNIKIFEADALDVLIQWVPEKSLDKVQLFFPDPWPKKHHHKRRLVQPSFLALLTKRLKTGGIFHTATDDRNYFRHINAVVAMFPNFTKAESQLKAFHAALRPSSRYAKRGERLGNLIQEEVYQNE